MDIKGEYGIIAMFILYWWVVLTSVLALTIQGFDTPSRVLLKSALVAALIVLLAATLAIGIVNLVS